MVLMSFNGEKKYMTDIHTEMNNAELFARLEKILPDELWLNLIEVIENMTIHIDYLEEQLNGY